MDATALLERLRAKLKKELDLLLDQTAKGLKRKAYWTCVGQIRQVKAMLEEIQALIKSYNSGAEEDGEGSD